MILRILSLGLASLALALVVLAPLALAEGAGEEAAGQAPAAAADSAKATETLAAQAEAFVAWARANAVAFATVDPAAAAGDLAALKAVVGDAQVVLLGQTQRDAREELQLSHRIIRFLVEEMGFTALAFEEDIATSEQLNAYLLRGEGDPVTLVENMASWEIWSTQEFVALLKWLRAYDKDPANTKKVRMYGIDFTGPYATVTDVLAYLGKVDPDYAVFLVKGPTDFNMLKADSWLQVMTRYFDMRGTKRKALTDCLNGVLARFEEKRSDYIARSSEAEYAWALREALAAKRANDFFVIGSEGTHEETDNIRTAAMVDNVLWLTDEALKGERLIVWAHDFSVSRDYLDVRVGTASPLSGVLPMGKFLGQDLGDKMVSIGFSCGQGDYPDSLLPPAPRSSIDGTLARVGKPLFMLDLRKAPQEGPVRVWLDSQNGIRGLGGKARLAPGRAYDAMIFIDRVTPAALTVGSRMRLETLDKKYSIRTVF